MCTCDIRDHQEGCHEHALKKGRFKHKLFPTYLGLPARLLLSLLSRDRCPPLCYSPRNTCYSKLTQQALALQLWLGNCNCPRFMLEHRIMAPMDSAEKQPP